MKKERYTYPLTEWGKLVRHKLIDLNISDKWLIEQVKLRGDCFMDGTYLLNILNGRVVSKPKCELIDQILAEEEKANAV